MIETFNRNDWNQWPVSLGKMARNIHYINCDSPGHDNPQMGMATGEVCALGPYFYKACNISCLADAYEHCFMDMAAG